MGNRVFVQFLVMKAMCLKSLYKIKNEYLSLREKEIILNAYEKINSY
jgi:hypothetical protein